MAVTIRLAASSDFAAIAALTNHFIRHTPVHFGNVEVTAGELRSAWQSEEPVRYPWLVAEVDGAFAGYAKASAWRTRPAYLWTAETTIYLEAAHRGHGVGRTLYERLLAVLAAQGFRSAIGGITLPNPDSVRVHEATGFVACGVVRDAGCKYGRWHDVGFWQRRLAETPQPGGAIVDPETAFARTAASR